MRRRVQWTGRRHGAWAGQGGQGGDKTCAGR